MTKKYIVQIDVTPEVEDYRRNEYEIKTEQDILKLILDGYKVHTVADIVGAAKKLDELMEGVMPGDKYLYFQGIKTRLYQMISSQMRLAKMPNGKELKVREFVASVPDNQPLDDTHNGNVNGEELESVHHTYDTQKDSDTFLSSSDPAAVQRALDYLENTVPGYVMGRLKIIAEHNGDYKGAADRLIEKIREMVKVIEEPVKK